MLISIFLLLQSLPIGHDPALGSPETRRMILLVGAVATGIAGLFVVVKTLARWRSLRRPVAHLLGGVSMLAFAAVVIAVAYFVVSNLKPLGE